MLFAVEPYSILVSHGVSLYSEYDTDTSARPLSSTEPHHWSRDERTLRWTKLCNHHSHSSAAAPLANFLQCQNHLNHPLIS